MLIEDDRVTVTATVPSYYARQLVEHKSRSIIVDQWRKKFVSRVDVKLSKFGSDANPTFG